MSNNISNTVYDVIIIGGSYAGLSAAMSLGRALRNVLVIDSGNPCNKYAPHAHNFVTHDGSEPAAIAAAAKEQVLKYDTVAFIDGKVTGAEKHRGGFYIRTLADEVFNTRKLIFATGLTDVMPEIEGFTACWGISILHCPYCHGYEVRDRRTAVIINGEMAYELCKMISNWTNDLVLLTNGPATLTGEQSEILKRHSIDIIQTPVSRIEHEDGSVKQVVFTDGSSYQVDAIYARPVFKQQCTLPLELGCGVTDHGLIDTDIFQKTCVDGVYAAGDNSTMGRAVSLAVANGALAGMMVNKQLIEEDF